MEFWWILFAGQIKLFLQCWSRLPRLHSVRPCLPHWCARAGLLERRRVEIWVPMRLREGWMNDINWYTFDILVFPVILILPTISTIKSILFPFHEVFADGTVFYGFSTWASPSWLRMVPATVNAAKQVASSPRVEETLSEVLGVKCYCTSCMVYGYRMI